MRRAIAGSPSAGSASTSPKPAQGFDTRTFGSAKLIGLIGKVMRAEVKQGPESRLPARDRA